MKNLTIAAGCCVLALACASPEPVVLSPDALAAAEQADFLARLSERMQSGPALNPDTLMNSLEHLLPTWHSEHRRGRAEPLEDVLTITVVPNYMIIEEKFLEGPHERQLVAAWALGFSRVPENDMGIESRHLDAVALIIPRLESSPDDLLRNELLALWKLGEPTTPVSPLVDILVNHHDADVRANAMLALSAVLTEQSVREHRNAVLVALEDVDARVRLHAASVARAYPDRAFTVSMEARLAEEDTPLVRANLAAALGAAGARSAAPLLIGMLASPRQVESDHAHAALVRIFGRDLGRLPEDWQPVLAP